MLITYMSSTQWNVCYDYRPKYGERIPPVCFLVKIARLTHLAQPLFGARGTCPHGTEGDPYRSLRANHWEIAAHGAATCCWTAELFVYN